MPLMRVEVRNEYGFGAPEMYMEANNDEPGEILQGVAAAGLVGVLRQLGDLADFAAEVFHGLQEEVMITCSRSYKLMVRVQQIEAALVPVEKALLAQQSHVHFAYTAGVNCHAPVRCERNHFVYNDMPQFIFDSYEDCRSPPHFHMLDRFDPGGPGSCLRRYSDPTIFIKASETSGDASQKVARDMRVQKSKKQRSWPRNGEVSQGASFAYHSARMQFPQSNVGGRTSSHQPISTLRSDSYEQSNSDQINGLGCSKDDNVTQDQGVCDSYSDTGGEKTAEPEMEKNYDHDTDLESFTPRLDLETLGNDAFNYETVDRLDIQTCMRTFGSGAIHLNDFESEADHHFMDAPIIIEPESGTGMKCMRKQDVDHFSKLEDKAAVDGLPENRNKNLKSQASISESNIEADSSIVKADCGHKPVVVFPESCSPDCCSSGRVPDSTNEESISCRGLSNFRNNGSGMPIIDDAKRSYEPDEKHLPEASDVTSVTFWTNGGLLGLQPSKPPLSSVFNDLPEYCLSKEDWKRSSSTQHVVFRDRDPQKSDETNSFQNIEEGLDRDYFTCHEYQESDQLLREKFWKRGNLLHPDDANSSGASVSASGSFLSVNSDFQAARNHPENAGSSSRKFELSSKLQGTLVQSPPSSPPLDHMKISVQPMDGFKTSKLKLKFRGGDIIDRGSIDIFPSFQLVPEVSNTRLDVNSDSDDDTFCRSSPSLADDSHDDHSESNYGRPPSGEDHDLYDSLCRFSLAESVSTVEEKGGTCLLEPEYATADPPPMQPHLDANVNSCDAMETADEQMSKAFSSEKSNAQGEANQSKKIDENNFLNQIRRKSLSLRPTVAAKANVASRSSTNVQVMTILEKANAIRQAVGSDDGDNWSDT